MKQARAWMKAAWSLRLDQGQYLLDSYEINRWIKYKHAIPITGAQ